MNLNHIELVDVRTRWKEASALIQECFDKSNEPDSKPEDVYAECVTGHATTFMAIDQTPGILVLWTDINRFTGRRFLFIRLAYIRAVDDPIDAYMDDIITIAKDQDCHDIEFETMRKGFERRPKWKRLHTRHRMTLRED